MSLADVTFINMCKDVIENGTSTEGEKVYITFILLAISFIIIAFTGICMDFKILILPKTLSKPLHIYLGYFMIILVIIHLIDNRRWIKNIFK